MIYKNEYKYLKMYNGSNVLKKMTGYKNAFIISYIFIKKSLSNENMK